MPSDLPAKTLDDYLQDVSNHSIKDDLEHLGSTNVLGFFLLLDRLVALVRQGKPSEAVRNVEALNMPGGVTVLTLYHLREKIAPHRVALPGLENETPDGSVMVLDKEFERWKALYPPDIYAQNDPDDTSREARQILWCHYAAMEGLDILIRKAIAEGEAKRALEIEIRQSERDRMEASINQIVQAAIAEAGIKRNPEYTLNRQVLALGFMLKHLGVRKIDKSKQAKFIEFLIGKTYKDIYDKLRELEDRVIHRKGEDAHYVINQFRELELEDISKEIEDILKDSNL